MQVLLLKKSGMEVALKICINIQYVDCYLSRGYNVAVLCPFVFYLFYDKLVKIQI